MAVLLATVLVMGENIDTPFIYFNFETARLRVRLPRGVALALMMLAAVEFATRVLVHYHVINCDPSLRTTIESRVYRINTVHPPVWWIGNSTLDYGVDIDAMQPSLGVPMIKLPHGSATLAATAEML